MQISADRKKRISYRDRAKFRNCAASFLHHLPNIRTRQDGDKLEPLRIGTTVVAAPIVVCAAHGGAQFDISQSHTISEVAVVAGGEQDLYVPTIPIHVFEPDLRGPPLAISFAILLF
jgi:hypothetical protein